MLDLFDLWRSMKASLTWVLIVPEQPFSGLLQAHDSPQCSFGVGLEVPSRPT